MVTLGLCIFVYDSKNNEQGVTMTANVPAAAALLDRVLPNWYNKVDLSTLNMESPSLCVLGQAFGSYITALNILGNESDGVFGWNGPGRVVFDNNRYREAWGRAIENRRSSTTTSEPHEPTFSLADLRHYLDEGKTLADIVNINTEVTVTLTVAEVEALREVIRHKRNPSTLLVNAAERLANV